MLLCIEPHGLICAPAILAHDTNHGLDGFKLSMDIRQHTVIVAFAGTVAVAAPAAVATLVPAWRLVSEALTWRVTSMPPGYSRDSFTHLLALAGTSTHSWPCIIRVIKVGGSSKVSISCWLPSEHARSVKPRSYLAHVKLDMRACRNREAYLSPSYVNSVWGHLFVVIHLETAHLPWQMHVASAREHPCRHGTSIQDYIY